MHDPSAGPLFLIGYRGTGKTTVAKLLAERLQWPWIDADDEIERTAGMRIRDIFEQLGETAFRDMETDVLTRLAALTGTVIALGGGAIMREQNRRAIAGRGRTVWLRATPESIWQRLQMDDATSARRPNLTVSGGYEEVRHLLSIREPFYRQCADWSVDTEGKTPEAVRDDILRWLQCS